MKIERARYRKRTTYTTIAQGGRTTVGRSLWWNVPTQTGGQSLTVSHHDPDGIDTYHVGLSSEDILMILRAAMDPDEGHPPLKEFQQQVRDTVNAR